MRISRYNATAGRIIGTIRARLGMTQSEYARALADLIGLNGMSQSALSAYETGNRQVPAAIALAALDLGRINGIPAGDLIDQYLSASMPHVETKARQEAVELLNDPKVAGAIRVLAGLIAKGELPE